MPTAPGGMRQQVSSNTVRIPNHQYVVVGRGESSLAHAPAGPRVMHVTNLMLEVRDWVRKHFPYWDR